MNLHFRVWENHDVNLNGFDVVAIVANHPRQFHSADFVHLFCDQNFRFLIVLINLELKLYLA